MLVPQTVDELCEVIREHAARGAALPLCGGGTRGAPEGRLSSRGLTGVRLYEPGALSLVAAAGTPLEEIEALLAKHGQMLPFEPMDHRRLLGTSGTPTLGGAIAMNASGPRRMLAGSARDHLLGVDYVDGHGQRIKNGGRVMKNVTGYDLARLMAGSRGQLGMITEVALKTLPQPEATLSLVFTGLDVPQALFMMQEAITSPYEVSGAAHMPATNNREAKSYLRLEGFAVAVQRRSEALRTRLKAYGAAELIAHHQAKAPLGQSLWADLRDVTALTKEDAAQSQAIWQISARATEAGALYERIMQADPSATLLLDWGGARLFVATAPGHDLRATLGRYQGYATQLRGEFPSLEPKSKALDAIEHKLRHAFDPKGIFYGGHHR